MTRKINWFTAFALAVSTFSQAETAITPTAIEQPSVTILAADTSPITPVVTTEPTITNPPVRDAQLSFTEVAPPPGTFSLLGTRPEGQVEFGVRSDEVVSQAMLNLEFTPSPSLAPIQSQLKVYLNDELMGVHPLTKEQLGRSNRIQMPIDPRYITDFNRLRLVFVGNLQSICENPTSSTLWLDVSKSSSLDLRFQMLPLKNELSHFPEPFFDSRDKRRLTLPMVFAGQPDLAQQHAAGILASWFGTKAQWRGQSFPVLFNQLPEQHAIVFATNKQRPDFLKDSPAVNGPTVQMISHPDNPYVKLLLIEGRDDNDLITAVKGIAQGNILFRGQNLTVDKVEQLAERQPYDAPNWVRTDRAVTFNELQQYAEQLQTDGVLPGPIIISMNLPPDLFLLRSTGIDMQLKYRYTSPRIQDGSRLSISLNNQFLQSYALEPENEKGTQLLRLPLLQGLFDSDTVVNIPALKLGATNQLRFDFEYTTLLASNAESRCETYSLIANHAVIDGSSTIDFTGYRHFIAMPDLRSFANAGFPFSRLADLSQTLVLVNKQPHQAQVSALLNALGNVGAQTGYPALAFTLADDWSQAKDKDADILLIGSIPPELRDDNRLNLLVEATLSWVKQPMRQLPLPSLAMEQDDTTADGKTTISSQGAMAAIVGVQSPFNDQRSIVALLADSPQGYDLLNNALLDSGKRAAVFGSVSVIRESGVYSLRVGDVYHVGYLPWWERIWFALSTHPVLLAVVAAVVVVIMALLLRYGLKAISRRRLSPEERD
ncbi:cellulose biosynthesis cyclic di-GMP-binding regulatory protein BcsB [Serratia sp. UGAL515B_01]|uniref:cellulose biosynthesis cyclic di-GMP-binding regulatory protein BcsB n=1 Tax=Serratia sp. UGAL515B_01 TaxID=2986763 RepID=UPI0029535338|nr:cellulose biosynthesis cyclic di-GMP-binding regulatory protein BcsB [Serratia sp. UGAL515B_01]WON77082.1 cellulose biosynthesis cyclic di-GMP-binding regulatory protein BcsB [Serratia sp. UGAL515B_01]